MIIQFEQMAVEVVCLSANKLQERWKAIPCVVSDTREGHGSTMMEAIIDLREKME